MINQMLVELKLPNHVRPNYLGSVLHGALMAHLPDDLVKQLHHQFAYSPLKQRIYIDKNKVIWEIVSMTNSLTQALMKFFSIKQKVYLKHYQTYINFGDLAVKKYDIKEMMDSCLGTEDLNRFINIKVRTPMSFKFQKRYMIFPDIHRFFRSTMIQFDTFFDSYKMYDKETLDFIEQQINIVDYKLKSVKFHLESVKIPSFMGEITLKVNGPLPFVQLIHFLLKFGELSGTGIKTSLGMGKYSIIEQKNNKDTKSR